MSKLTEPVGKEKKKKKLSDRIILAIEIVLVASMVIMACPLTLMLVRNYGYGEVFFVNGASMYPSLNGDAYRPAANRKLTWNDSKAAVGDLLDYGWGKRAKGDDFFKGLKRFDVLMTYYPSDYSGNSLSKNASIKIKRLIAFPGETITITYDPSRNPDEVFGYSVWGETTIKDVSGNVFTLPNLYSEADYPDYTYSNGNVLKYTSLGNPVDGNGILYRSRTWVLKDDEYFLCGDNRRGGKSGDSRGFSNNERIKTHMILGKAYLVTGRREYLSESEVKFRLDQVRMPWDYINLENHP